MKALTHTKPARRVIIRAGVQRAGRPLPGFEGSPNHPSSTGVDIIGAGVQRAAGPLPGFGVSPNHPSSTGVDIIPSI